MLLQSLYPKRFFLKTVDGEKGHTLIIFQPTVDAPSPCEWNPGLNQDDVPDQPQGTGEGHRAFSSVTGWPRRWH